MSIINPLPLWLTGLIPLIIIGYATSVSISRRMFEDRLTRNIFAAGLYLAMFIIAVIYFSVFFKSFVWGITAGSVLLFLISIYVEYRIYSGSIIIKPLIDRSESISRISKIAGLISTLLIFYIAYNGNFHDEEFANGHKTIIAQLQNNVFPPVNILYPSEPLRYHFGFDLLCAAMTAVTRCSVDFSIDFITACSWLFCWIGLALVARRLFPVRNSELWVPAITLFGGGLAVFFGIFNSNQPLAIRLTGAAASKTEYIFNPPMIEYFFQHPFAGALPVTITALLVLFEKGIADKTREKVLCVLLLALYFSQTVLFATLLAGVSFYFVIVRKRYHFILYSVGILILAYISQTGLLFTPTNKKIGSEFIFRFWPNAYSFAIVILWYIGSVGMLIPFAIAGLWKIDNKLKLLFAALLGMTVFVPFFFKYKYAFDIIKFIAVGNFYLGILSGGAVAWIASSQFRIRRALIYGSFASLTITGFMHVGYMLYSERAELRITEAKFQQDYIKYGKLKFTDNFGAAVNWCRENLKDGSVFVDDADFGMSFAVNSGLPTICNEQWHLARAFATPEEKILMYAGIFKDRKISVGQLNEMGVKYILHDCNDEFKLTQMLNENFEERADFGKLVLYEYKPLKATLALLNNRPVK
jgi:hypothetical protein